MSANVAIGQTSEKKQIATVMNMNIFFIQE